MNNLFSHHLLDPT
jgi:hypothetical protein